MGLREFIAEEREKFRQMSLGEVLDKWNSADQLGNSMLGAMLEDEAEEECIATNEAVSNVCPSIEDIIQAGAESGIKKYLFDVAEQSIRNALLAVDEIDYKPYAKIVYMLARTGRPEKAAAILRNAAKSDKRAGNWHDKMIYIANLQASFGFGEDAKKTIGMVLDNISKYDSYKSSCQLLGAAKSQANAGLTKDALKTAERISLASKKADACRHIIRALIEKGKAGEARQVLGRVPIRKLRREIEAEIMEGHSPASHEVDRQKYAIKINWINELTNLACNNARKGEVKNAELAALFDEYVKFDAKFYKEGKESPTKLGSSELASGPKGFHKVVLELLRRGKEDEVRNVIDSISLSSNILFPGRVYGDTSDHPQSTDVKLDKHVKIAEICSNVLFFLGFEKYLEDTQKYAEEAAVYLAQNMVNPPGSPFREMLLNELGRLYAQTYRFDESLKAAGDITIEPTKSELLKQISEKMAIKHDYKNALQCATSIGNRLIRATAYRHIAEYMWEEGLKAALDVCEMARKSVDSENIEGLTGESRDEQKAKKEGHISMIGALEAQIKKGEQVEPRRESSRWELQTLVDIEELRKSDKCYVETRTAIAGTMQQLSAHDLADCCSDEQLALKVGGDYIRVASTCNAALSSLVECTKVIESLNEQLNKQVAKEESEKQVLEMDKIVRKGIYDGGLAANIKNILEMQSAEDCISQGRDMLSIAEGKNPEDAKGAYKFAVAFFEEAAKKRGSAEDYSYILRCQKLAGAPEDEIRKTEAKMKECEESKSLDKRYTRLCDWADGLFGSEIGKVYSARTSDSKPCKVVVLDAKENKTKTAFDAARKASSLKNKNIARIIDLGDLGYLGDSGIEEKRPCFVLDVPEGYEPLSDIDVPLEMLEAVNIACQIAAALVYAHNKKVYHGCISPEAVLYNREKGAVMLAHFGLAGIIYKEMIIKACCQGSDEPNPIQVPALLWQFTPVENPAEKKDPASDVNSLGMLMYYLITGKVVGSYSLSSGGGVSWQRSTKLEYNSALAKEAGERQFGRNAELQEIVEKMLSEEAERRPALSTVKKKLVRIRKSVAKRIESEVRGACERLEFLLAKVERVYGVSLPEDAEEISTMYNNIEGYENSVRYTESEAPPYLFAEIKKEVWKRRNNDEKQIKSQFVHDDPEKNVQLARKNGVPENKIKERNKAYEAVGAAWGFWKE